MATKKKATKKVAAKITKVHDSIQRVYGATVFSMSGVDPTVAKGLVDDHGFRVKSNDPDGVALFADKIAFDSYKAAK